MDSASIRARLSELTLRLDQLKPSEEMTPSVRVEMAATLDAIASEAERDVVAPLQTSTDNDLRDEGARFFRKLSQANSWLEGRDAFSKDWIDNAAGVVSSLVLKDMIVVEQNRLRDPEAFAGIRELCESGRMDKARRVLASRLRRTTDPVARQRIQETLKEPRNFLAPLKGAPAMITYNGIGTMLLGKRALKPDGTFIATLYLVFFFIPLLPLRSYFVRRADGNNWLFMARAPLGAFAFWWRRLIVIGPIILGLGLWGVDAYNSSPSVRENAALAKISESVDMRFFAGALRHLSNFFTADPGRRQKADQLARTALVQYLGTVQDATGAKNFVDMVGPAIPNPNRGWVEGEVAAAAEKTLDTIRTKPDAGPAVARFLEWMGAASKELEARLPALSIRACDSLDDPRLIARTIEIHRKANAAVPPGLVKRLGAHLVKNRHASWDEDAITYLAVADPAEIGPVLDARLKNTWIGAASDPGLRDMASLPEPLQKLIEADREARLEPKIALLEKAADPTGLEEPRKNWHRLGVARRLMRAIETQSNQDPVRFPLSKSIPWAMQALELDPDDVDARTLAIRALIMNGEFEKADQLATPALKESRVAFLAGVARARLGRHEEAAQLLRPFVERDFPKFIKAIEGWNLTYELRSQYLWKRLERGEERELIKRLNRMPTDTRQAAAQAWVDGHLNNDPQLKALRRDLEELSDAQSAAYELAMIELALGRAATPGPARSERLGAAEKLFRDLRKTASGDVNQDLHLAQVCAWLGKESEAKEIFDRIMKSDDGLILYQLGTVLRELGRPAAARSAYERAYEKATGAQKPDIAWARSVAADTNDDKLAWLEKSNKSNPHVQFEIDQARGQMMAEKGDFEGAVEAFQRVAAHFAKLPPDPTTLNNASLNLQSLAAASGDLRHHVEALKLQKKAYELEPQGGIRLANYIRVLEEVGAGALAGSALRADVLHEVPDTGWFEWVSPLPSAEQWAARVKAQPELRLASELGGRLVVLSSDLHLGYRIQATYFIYVRDADSLHRLRESVEAAPPAMADTAARSRDMARGIYSVDLKRSMSRILAGRFATAARAREAKHGPTLAYALTQLVAARRSAELLGLPEAGTDACEKELEEALAAFDTYPTRRGMAAHLMDRAAAAVAADDSDFARWTKENPSLPAGTLLALYARKYPEKAGAIRLRPEVAKATEALIAAEKAKAYFSWMRSWFWLDAMNHPSKEAALKRIREDASLRDTMMLDFLLDPESPGECISAWIAAEAWGDEKTKALIESQAKKSGHVPAFFGK